MIDVDAGLLVSGWLGRYALYLSRQLGWPDCQIVCHAGRWTRNAGAGCEGI